MSASTNIIRCVDVVALLKKELVIIERLNPPLIGKALPGGKVEDGESVLAAAKREFPEETGLVFTFEGSLGVYDEEGRDPRGRYISTVLFGTAHGTPKAEEGKTRIILIPPREIMQYREEFVCDHAKILSNYLAMKARKRP